MACLKYYCRRTFPNDSYVLEPISSIEYTGPNCTDLGPSKKQCQKNLLWINFPTSPVRGVTKQRELGLCPYQNVNEVCTNIIFLEMFIGRNFGRLFGRLFGRFFGRFFGWILGHFWVGIDYSLDVWLARCKAIQNKQKKWYDVSRGFFRTHSFIFFLQACDIRIQVV